MTLQRLFVTLFGLDPPGADKLRLEDTALCVDCETLSPARGDACIACGGRALLNLKRVLGGIRPEDSARLVEPVDWWSRITTTFEAAALGWHDSTGTPEAQADFQSAGDGTASCPAVHDAG